MSAARPVPVATGGDHPAAQAWRRLRRNRMAVVGMVAVAGMGLAGLTSPWIARHVVGLSESEQHAWFTLAPPGTRDVGLDYPRYDGDKAAFALLDRDGDGVLTCSRAAIASLGANPKRSLQVLARGSGVDPEALEALAPRAAVPLAQLAPALAGPLSCPELDEARQLERFYAFLHDLHDGGGLGGGGAPDGQLERAEYPDDISAVRQPHLGPLLRARGLLGDAGFAAVDLDGSGRVDRLELAAATRWTRIDKTHLLHHHDTNRDLRISRAEFPGLPALRTFWLGTDSKGRDLLVRLCYGARISLAIGLLATLVSFCIGVTWGAVSGYLGGAVDAVMMRVVDVLYGLPFMFIVILLLVVAGRSTINLFIALGAVSWLNMARIVRGQVLSVRQREYVEASRALGASGARVLFAHVLPNTVGPVIVYTTLMVPAVILEEAFLSFLGLGVQPPNASWGTLVSEGTEVMTNHPWLIVFPAGALAVTLFSLNFIGDGLRDALDPRHADR